LKGSGRLRGKNPSLSRLTSPPRGRPSRRRQPSPQPPLFTSFSPSSLEVAARLGLRGAGAGRHPPSTLPWRGRARGAPATGGAAWDARAWHRSEEQRRGGAGLRWDGAGGCWTAATSPKSRPFRPHLGLWLVVLAATVTLPADGGDGSLMLGMVTTAAGLLQGGGGLYGPNLPLDLIRIGVPLWGLHTGLLGPA
jgi:hypothetical protein